MWFSCETCDLIKHTNPYRCSNYMLVNLQVLLRHFMKPHTRIDVNSIQVRSHALVNDSILLWNVKLHTGERPYICSDSTLVYMQGLWDYIMKANARRNVHDVILFIWNLIFKACKSIQERGHAYVPTPKTTYENSYWRKPLQVHRM